jgi:hypothetical protein
MDILKRYHYKCAFLHESTGYGTIGRGAQTSAIPEKTCDHAGCELKAEIIAKVSIV